jgi:amidase
VFFIDEDKRKFRILSVAGPMARSIEDLRLALSIIAGADHQDSHVPPVPWQDIPRPDVRELKIAWTATFPDMPIIPAISAAIETLADKLAQLGGKVENRLPDLNFTEQSRLGQQLFELLAPALEPRPDDTPIPSIDDYLEQLILRDGYITAWERFFTEWDVFLCPAGPITAKRQTEKGLEVVGLTVADDQLSLLNIPYNISPVSGCPTVVIPLGHDSDGLPFGVQLLGKRWADERLLAIAEGISEIAGGFQRPPGY